MTNTAKITCRDLVAILSQYGVRNAVISPGTRDTPLIMAFNRNKEIKTFSVIDERSAAFVALGISTVLNEPVALVCTSGTATLNYAPAIAEAFYRQVPLIVITADRPADWIDQDDSQTIRQPGIYSNYILKTYSLPDTPRSTDNRCANNRRICEGMLIATGLRKGPVHFNIEIDEPISEETDCTDEPLPKIINRLPIEADVPTTLAREIGRQFAPPAKIMVVIGFNKPDSVLNKALNKLAEIPNVIVVAERTANLHTTNGKFLELIDSTLMSLGKEEIDSLRPDVVISAGGSLVSRALKETIRKWHPQHWIVGNNHEATDCFRSLEMIVNTSAPTFFRRFASAMQPWKNSQSNYSKQWLNAQNRALRRSLAARSAWSDVAAVEQFASLLPRNVNLQVSNGMTLRHLLSAPMLNVHRIDCNRGVSGIDGSTSTALGASLVYGKTTVLLTGDMSAQYDLGALASNLITPRFKIAVVANGAGEIFRTIRTTRSVAEMERFMAMRVNLPLEKLAESFGFSFYKASNSNELKAVFNDFINDTEKPSILMLDTSAVDNSQILREHYKFIRQSETK